jgi:hypothetical protein
LLHGGFLLINPAHLRAPRPLVEQRRECPELVDGTDRVHLDSSVVLIANPASKTETSRVLLDEVAKPDALDETSNKPAPRLERRFAQDTGSIWSIGCLPSSTWRTVEPRCCRVKGFAISANPFSTT